MIIILSCIHVILIPHYATITIYHPCCTVNPLYALPRNKYGFHTVCTSRIASSPSLINSAATCRAVACLLKELEEEDPAGGFGLPADFPASTLTILLFRSRPHSSVSLIHFSISLSVVSLCLGQGWRWERGRREAEPKISGDAVATSANSFSLLPDGFIRLPTY